MFKIICSNILHDVLVNDIGLTLEGSPLFPALGIGVILAFLQSSGSSDTARDLRKTKPRYLLHHCTYRLRKGLGKLSGPEDFFLGLVWQKTKYSFVTYIYWVDTRDIRRGGG